MSCRIVFSQFLLVHVRLLLVITFVYNALVHEVYGGMDHQQWSIRAFEDDLGACLADGEWVDRRDLSMLQRKDLVVYREDPFSVYSSSCPMLQLNYLCNQSHLKSANRFLYATPARCGPLVTAEQANIGSDANGCLAKMKIDIIGDSLPHQFASSIECRLRNHIVSRRIVRTFEFKGQTREKEVLTTFRNGMSIRYLFIGNNGATVEHPLNSRTNPRDFWKLANADADVVVTNLEVFHMTDIEYSRQTRTEKILSYGPVFAAWPGRVVILGAPAKHVNDLGFFDCGHDNLSLRWLRNWAGHQVEGLISHKNRALRWLALKNKLDFIETEAITASRLDAHISARDCSHYCMPGIPDVWVDHFTTMLCKLQE